MRRAVGWGPLLAAAISAALILTGVGVMGRSVGEREVRTGIGPVTERSELAQSPAIASEGESALVVRGIPDSNGALYDVDTGARLWEGSLPFSDPIAYPDVLALGGGNYLVAGVPCASVALDGSQPECTPGGIAVGRFDTKSHAFEVVNVAGFDDTTPFINMLGLSGSAYVIQIGGTVYNLPDSGGTLAPYKPPPLDNMALACLHDDRVVAVELEDGWTNSSAQPGEVVQEEYKPYVPFEAATLDLRTGEWEYLGGPDATYDSVDTFELGCIDGGALAVPSERPIAGRSPYVSFLLDLETHGWTPAAPPPRQFLAASEAASDGRHFVVAVSSDLEDKDTAVLVFDGVSRSWHAQAGGDGASSGPVAVAQGRMLNMPSTDSVPRVATLSSLVDR